MRYTIIALLAASLLAALLCGVQGQSCSSNCNGRGVCLYGQCRCNEGYMGSACESNACYETTIAFSADNVVHGVYINGVMVTSPISTDGYPDWSQPMRYTLLGAKPGDIITVAVENSGAWVAQSNPGAIGGMLKLLQNF
jgi:hypothetical protein